MEKVIVELTLGESVEVCNCIEIKVDRIKNQCIRTQDLLDRTDPTHIAYQHIKSNLDLMNDSLACYVKLMNKFHPLLIFTDQEREYGLHEQKKITKEVAYKNENNKAEN